MEYARNADLMKDGMDKNVFVHLDISKYICTHEIVSRVRNLQSTQQRPGYQRLNKNNICAEYKRVYITSKRYTATPIFNKYSHTNYLELLVSSLYVRANRKK